MEDVTDHESVMAVLRPDALEFFLHLRDEMVDQTIVPEYADYTEDTLLYAHLQGEMCSSSVCIRIDVEELVGLIQSLRELTSLRTHHVAWETSYRQVEIRLNVQMQKMGPPVVCDVWLRDSISAREEHHCCFDTNLPWITAFLADIEHMALRYRRVLVYLGEG